MINSKRGVMFEGMMFLVVFLILTTSFIALYNKQNNFPAGYSIGERQFSIIKTYQEAEKQLLYIDQSAYYSLRQSIHELARNGGLLEAQEKQCGKYQGASVLYTIRSDESGALINQKCNKNNDPISNLEHLFNEKLNNYLLIYPENLPVNNYDYRIENGLKITGLSINPLRFNIYSGEGKNPKIGTVIEENGEQKDIMDFTQIDLWEGKTPERYRQKFPDESLRRSKVCYPYSKAMQKGVTAII